MRKQSDKSREWNMTFYETAVLFFSKSHYEKNKQGEAVFQIKRDFEDIIKWNAWSMFGSYYERHFGNNWGKFE